MSADQTLRSIDATLDDYDQWHGHSPDAARWAGGPTEGHIEVQALRLLADFSVTFEVATAEFTRIMLDLARSVLDVKRQAEAETGKSWAYLVQRAQRPHSAAERTSSPQRRAGSRRTKRQARRRG